MTDRIAVLIPAFNAERYLGAAIESVLAQTHRDFTLLIVDDGSTDNTLNIAVLWATRDVRVQWLALGENHGCAAARNAGLRYLDTAWVALLDSDDVMLPDRLERQLRFAQAHPGAGALAGRAEYIAADGRCTGKHTEHLGIETPALLADRLNRGRIVALNQSATMIHRARVLALGGYREDLQFAEDVDLWARLIEAGHPVLQRDEVVSRYRVHPASAMTSRALECWTTACWVEACIHARRAGLPEPPLARYVASRTGTALGFVAFEREVRGLAAWRAAVTRWINGRRAAATWWLAVAAVLRPHYVAERLRLHGRTRAKAAEATEMLPGMLHARID